MIKKIVLSLCAAAALANFYATSSYASHKTASSKAMPFDPETSEASKRSTLKTWIDGRHLSCSRTFAHLQEKVALTAPENPDSTNYFKHVINNEGDTFSWGKTFMTLTPIEVPFLRHAKKLAKTEEHPITMEFAAARGYVSWKVPFCFSEKGGTHYVNELSSVMLDNDFEETIKDRFQGHEELKDYLKKIPGNCFDIPTSHPELVGKIQAIYVQNLEHFFNPQKHQAFLALIETLLAPGGKAFLSAQSILKTKEAALYDFYQAQHQQGKTYQGFFRNRIQLYEIGYKNLAFDITYEHILRPESDDEPIAKKTLQNDYIGDEYIAQFNDTFPIFKIRQELVENRFSKEVYKKAIQRFNKDQQMKGKATLMIDDLFYIECLSGEKFNAMGDKTSHAAVIVTKSMTA